MLKSEKLVYPAFILEEYEGMFGVYFPTLFPEDEDGWEFPLSRGETKREAINNAIKDLAYSLAGILYDNEVLPEPIPINSNDLSKGMELIDIETSFEPYAEEIKEHLKGRHWHITYYDEEKEDIIEAIGYKNEKGMWNIFFDYCSDDDIDIFDSFCKKNPDYPDYPLLFTVKLRNEAEEKFYKFVEDVILRR